MGVLRNDPSTSEKIPNSKSARVQAPELQNALLAASWAEKEMIDMKMHIDDQYTNIGKSKLQAPELRHLDLRGGAINCGSQVTRRELGDALSFVLFLGMLFLAAVNMSYVMHWALQSIGRAFGY